MKKKKKRKKEIEKNKKIKKGLVIYNVSHKPFPQRLYSMKVLSSDIKFDAVCTHQEKVAPLRR